MRYWQRAIIGGAIAFGILAAVSGIAQQQPPNRDPGRADRTIDRLAERAKEVTHQIQRDFQKARTDVDNLTVAGRVYARLHWDKALTDSSISVDVQDDGLAVLRGAVADGAAKLKAGMLAGDTVGVRQVHNELTIAQPARR